MVSGAASRGWGRGWPANRQGDMVQIRGGGVTVPAGVHREIAALTTWLLQRTVESGHRLVPGWCWGYARRPIRGTLTPSNHSWGLAVDLNAPKNPVGRRGDIPMHVVRLWEAWGFEWGGHWEGRRRDPMHFEFAGTPADARRLTALMVDHSPPSTPSPPPPSPPVVLPPPPAPPPVINPLEDDIMVTFVFTDPPATSWWAISGNTRREMAPNEPDLLRDLGMVNPKNVNGSKITPIYLPSGMLARIPDVTIRG